VRTKTEEVISTENKVSSAILCGMDPQQAYLTYGKSEERFLDRTPLAGADSRRKLGVIGAVVAVLGNNSSGLNFYSPIPCSRESKATRSRTCHSI
jgi:hypothetical protein